MKKNMKKIVSLLMAATVVLTSGTVVTAAEASDVSTVEQTTDSGDNTSAQTDGVPEENAAAPAEEEANVTEGNAAALAGESAASSESAASEEQNASEEGTVQTPVEGTVEVPAGEGADVNTSEGGANSADSTAQSKEIIGNVIVDENNDEVEIKEDDRPYLALGADLTEAQRQTVLSIMGINPAQLSDYDVVYVTNEEEHQYLGSYIDSAQIGTRSLSSVVIIEREKGRGLNISTNNITFCTVGMYKNALTTAGITDADIIVAGPTGISGTAALVGIFKAYQEMTGENIDESVVDAALNELVITGWLEESIEGLTDEEVEEFIAYIKAVIAENDLTDEDSINEVIDEACEKYGVTLTDEERQEIVDLLLKITSLGIDLNGLVDYAESLYDSFKNGGSSEGFFAAIGEFFSNIFSSIGDFFKGLFS